MLSLRARSVELIEPDIVHLRLEEKGQTRDGLAERDPDQPSVPT